MAGRPAGADIDFRKRPQRAGVIRAVAQEPYQLAFGLHALAALPQFNGVHHIRHGAGRFIHISACTAKLSRPWPRSWRCHIST
jgi:hypothetical protein